MGISPKAWRNSSEQTVSCVKAEDLTASVKAILRYAFVRYGGFAIPIWRCPESFPIELRCPYLHRRLGFFISFVFQNYRQSVTSFVTATGSAKRQLAERSIAPLAATSI